MRISDWSSDVCSSDLQRFPRAWLRDRLGPFASWQTWMGAMSARRFVPVSTGAAGRAGRGYRPGPCRRRGLRGPMMSSVLIIDGSYLFYGSKPHGHMDYAKLKSFLESRSEEHTSELQSLIRISYAVFCLKKKNNRTN